VAEKDSDTRALEADLSAHLGMAVQIDHGGGESGVLTVRFARWTTWTGCARRFPLRVPAEMG
jgi:hypothetical protein